MIDNSRHIECENRQLFFLSDISKKLLKQEGLNNIFSCIVNNCFENLDIPTLSIAYTNFINEDINYKAIIFQDIEKINNNKKEVFFSKNDKIIKKIKTLEEITKYKKLKNEYPAIANEDPLAILKADIIIPMKTKSLFIGFITIGSKKNCETFNSSEIQYLNTIANFATLAIENSILNNIIISDAKTHLYTYKYAIEQLLKEFNKSIRYNLPFSLVMCDIDYFKKVNDKYGHRFGDEILKYIAYIIKSEVRTIDIVGRYGGEEFIVVMPMTKKKGACYAVERIRKKITKKTYKFKDTFLKVTVSFGISSFCNNNYKNIEEIIDNADKALYCAKKSGRNLIVHCDDKILL